MRKSPKYMMITDACPKGIGGILVKRHEDGSHTIISAYEAIVSKNNALMLQLEHGEPSSPGGVGNLERIATLEEQAERCAAFGQERFSGSTVNGAEDEFQVSCPQLYRGGTVGSAGRFADP